MFFSPKCVPISRFYCKNLASHLLGVIVMMSWYQLSYQMCYLIVFLIMFIFTCFFILLLFMLMSLMLLLFTISYLIFETSFWHLILLNYTIKCNINCSFTIQNRILWKKKIFHKKILWKNQIIFNRVKNTISLFHLLIECSTDCSANCYSCNCVIVIFTNSM